MKFFLALISALSVSATKYTQCQAADQLKKYGMDKYGTLGDWICLTKYESSWNTNAVGPMNYDGTYDYGFYQINNYYWCYESKEPTYNDCNVNCSKLTDNNLSDDSACAKIIYNRHGYSAWYGWKNNCRSGTSKYASDCGY